MAAGFSESFIRIWSLKGEKLTGYRSDFQSSSVKDGELKPYNDCITTKKLMFPSYLVTQTARKGWLDDSEAHWP